MNVRTGLRRLIHTMMTATHKTGRQRACVLGVALLVAFSACTHEVGLFASLEQEIPVDEGRGFPNEGSIHNLVKHDGRYFAGGASLWVRTAVDESATSLQGWTRIAPPTSASRGTLDSMALVNGDIYAVYDGNVYQRTANADATAGAWNPVSEFNEDTAQRVFAVTVENGSLQNFVVSASVDGGNQLLDSDGEPVAELEAVNTIYAVLNFNDGTNDNIYVLTNSQVFQGDNDLGNFTDITAAVRGPATSTTFRDMQVRGSDDELWIAGRGRIYRFDGSDWTRTEEITPDDSSTPVQFTSIAFVTVDGTEYVLAGTQSNGLYEGDDLDDLSSLRAEGSGRTLLGRDGNYLTTQMAGGAVSRIVVDQDGSARDSTGPLVFVGAPGRGLWRGQPENGGFIWRRE